MVAGALYSPGDPELVAARTRAQGLLRRYNQTILGEDAARREILGALLAPGSAQPVIRPPFHCDYGRNIRCGAGVFLNFGCVILDVCPVEIGPGTEIGPYTQILAADHPRDAETRAKGLEMGRPITIGAQVWIGGGAILLPGITVGDGAVIGAGAVVTRDVPPHARVAGNPARPIG